MAEAITNTNEQDRDSRVYPTLMEHLREAYNQRRMSLQARAAASPEAAEALKAYSTFSGFITFCETYLAKYPPVEVSYPSVGIGLRLANNVNVVFSRPPAQAPLQQERPAGFGLSDPLSMATRFPGKGDMQDSGASVQITTGNM